MDVPAASLTLPLGQRDSVNGGRRPTLGSTQAITLLATSSALFFSSVSTTAISSTFFVATSAVPTTVFVISRSLVIKIFSSTSSTSVPLASLPPVISVATVTPIIAFPITVLSVSSSMSPMTILAVIVS
ncbi:hypothetical protein BC835DRAFT_816779 [Cytidiella melzeri]|nr:hypothetical protein BC835DRAFT_816779 [Cytidiella melzeri]